MCVGWDTGKLRLFEQHAVHAEKLVAQEKDKRNKKKEDQSHSAQLAMLQMVKQTAGIQYRRRGRGRGRGAVNAVVGGQMAVLHAGVKIIGLETVREGAKERENLVRSRMVTDRKRLGTWAADPKER
ncbi:uncharacterized protein DAT39_022599, partial [Clarias magur]